MMCPVPGKACDWFQKGAVIGYEKKEIQVSSYYSDSHAHYFLIVLNVSHLQLDTYEILVGDANAVKWVDVRGSFNLNSLGASPVKGGEENNGTPLYIAQAPYGDSDPIDVHPGKIAEGLDGEF